LPHIAIGPHHQLFCRECTQLGRQHIQEHVAKCVLLHLNVFHTIIAESIHSKYHIFVQNQGSKFQKPDLCIAFNSGASVVSTHTWLPTLKLLVEGKIPTVFTVRCRDVRVPHLFTNNDPLQSFNHCILTAVSRSAEAPRDRLVISRLSWVQNLSKCSESRRSGGRGGAVPRRRCQVTSRPRAHSESVGKHEAASLASQGIWVRLG
jgi:hypothetical protein